MNEEISALLEKLWKLNINRVKWAKPHKPLLVLIMLMRLRNEGTEKLEYKEVKEVLRGIIGEINKGGKSINVADPFWLLRKDKVWNVTKDGVPVDEKEVCRQGNRKDPEDKKLEELNPVGGFCQPILDELNAAPWLIDAIADRIIDKYFELPDTATIRQLIGFFDAPSRSELLFNKNVLKAYQSQCSICNRRQARMFNSLLELRASPIIPSNQTLNIHAHNGIALCNLHSSLFRSGLITFITDSSDRYSLKASKRLANYYGAAGSHAYKGSSLDLDRLQASNVFVPSLISERPSKQLLKVHNNSIFLN